MMELTKDNFQKETSKGKVLVDYWAPWCGPCRALAPQLERLKELVPDLTVVKVNVDKEPELSEAAGVQSIPLLVLMQDGEVVNRMSGAAPAERIRSNLDL